MKIIVPSNIGYAKSFYTLIIHDTGSIYDRSIYSYLKKIVEYRSSIKDTIRLFFTLDTSSCSILDVAIWRLLILFRKI